MWIGELTSSLNLNKIKIDRLVALTLNKISKHPWKVQKIPFSLGKVNS